MKKAIAGLAALSASILLVSACSVGSYKRPPEPTYEPPPAPTATPGDVSTAEPDIGPAAVCTTEAVKKALPSGTTLTYFKCASGYVGANVTINGKKTSIVLASRNGEWVDATKDICNEPPSEFPSTLSSYCPKSQ